MTKMEKKHRFVHALQDLYINLLCEIFVFVFVTLGHPSCLDMNEPMVEVIETYPWQCMECKTCFHCGDPTHEVGYKTISLWRRSGLDRKLWPSTLLFLSFLFFSIVGLIYSGSA